VVASSTIDLSLFWELLETDFPPSGLREQLAGRLGTNVVDALERGGILQFLRIAEEFPCPHPGEWGCPRKVVELSDGTYCAVCGNNPPECEDVTVTARDLEVIGVVPESLCAALRSPLLFGGKPEVLADIHQAYRAGTFVPAPAIRQPVFFLVRTDPEEYAEALDALRSRYERQGFAVLVPTDRFVRDDMVRQMATLGIAVVPLVGLVNTDPSGLFVSEVAPLKLFEGVGHMGLRAAGSSVFAQLCTKDGWRNLDETAYLQLMEQATEYEILADERSRTVIKRGQTQGLKPNANHFRMLRLAIEKGGYFDPGVDGPDEYAGGKEYEDPKQIFQRARQLIDIKYTDEHGHKAWCLFKTGMLDSHSIYMFKPDAEINFALVFVPSPQS